MAVKTTFNIRRLPLLCALVALSSILSIGSAFAQNTSGSIRVNVADPSGSPTSGVSIAITHMPTGRTQTGVSNSQGVVTARGLAVGGPYEVAVVGGGQYSADIMQDIYVELDQTEVVDFAARPVIEEIMVTAEAPTVQVALGVGSAFNRARIDATPSISRDFVNALATRNAGLRSHKILPERSVKTLRTPVEVLRAELPWSLPICRQDVRRPALRIVRAS